jgi:Holliday junction DNA helicase RuvA
MIGWLRGKVRARDVSRGEVVLDVGGVGYVALVSWQTLAAVPEEGGVCELWVHTHVREDALALYGFATVAEREVFRLLTSVPQVGPKLAVTVLGGFPLAELLGAIAGAERTTLERIPGIGRKTAERILLDLKDKVVPLLELLQGTGRPAAPATTPGGEGTLREEARDVLVGLGWKPKPVEAALDKVLAEDAGSTTLDGLVRRALAQLMAR